jgi:hypothetical protein
MGLAMDLINGSGRKENAPRGLLSKEVAAGRRLDRRALLVIYDGQQCNSMPAL